MFQWAAQVTSLSITQPGNVDLESVQDWVSDLLQNKGNDIYRMKGELQTVLQSRPLNFVQKRSVHGFLKWSFEAVSTYSARIWTMKAQTEAFT